MCIRDSNGDGTFSFKMPAGGVTVETDFTRIDYFDDVNEDDWFDEASWFCAAHGLMQGTGNRQFDGHMGTNRAMLVTVLYRLANSTDSLDSIFDDVESGKWYSDAIGWAARNKIVEGYGNGKFGPNDALTREQMVSVLYLSLIHISTVFTPVAQLGFPAVQLPSSAEWPKTEATAFMPILALKFPEVASLPSAARLNIASVFLPVKEVFHSATSA